MNKTTVGIVIIAVLLIASNATWAYYSMVVNQPTSTVKPIKIGVLLPFTGSTAFIGENARAAARLAMDEINEMGGILGRPVEIVVAPFWVKPTQLMVNVPAAAAPIDIVSMMRAVASVMAMLKAPVLVRDTGPVNSLAWVRVMAAPPVVKLAMPAPLACVIAPD